MDVCNKFLTVTAWIEWRIEFSFEDVYAYQRDADALFDVYFNITGGDGMTNYLHCLRAGHFAQFLIGYKNIYCYSQQESENVNKL